MKKTLLLLPFCCIITMMCLGQAATNPQSITIHGSYTATSDILVHPFDRPTQTVGTQLHFYLKKGTKFYVEQAVDLDGTTKGYVVSVWTFNDFLRDAVTSPGGNTHKIFIHKRYYDSLVSAFQRKVANHALLEDRVVTATVQTSNPPRDTSDYRRTKEQIGEKAERPDTGIFGAYGPYCDLAYVNSWANDFKFFVSATDFAANSVSIYPASCGKFTWGFLNLPLKLRFGNKDSCTFNFEQNLNFGLTFGLRQQMVSTEDISWNYLCGVSVVNVPLDKNLPDTAAASAAAFSLSAGVMFQYSKFQIGAFVGADWTGGRHISQFSYQGKPWLGIAIGLNLFGEGKTTTTAQTQGN